MHDFHQFDSLLLHFNGQAVDLGAEVAPDVFAAELAYLRDGEWAQTAKDVLWRRSKLGLHLDEAQQQAVADWLAAPAAAAPAAATVAAR